MNAHAAPDPESLTEHATFIRAVARAVLRGDGAIDDVVQDTYVAALGSGPRKPGAMRAWLAGIARRQAAARIRKRSMRRRNAPRLPKRAPEESALDVAVRVETSRRLTDAVMALDEPCRSTLLMRFRCESPARAYGCGCCVRGGTMSRGGTANEHYSDCQGHDPFRRVSR